MTETTANPEACLIIIGNEILSGRTQDINLAYLAAELNRIGVTMAEARVIPDIEDTIVKTVNECRAKYDYVFTTGGIGPTHDDITSESIAKAFGVEYELNAEAHALLVAHYKEGELNEARLRMARMGKGAELVENPISKAPGYRIGNVYVMAGVPVIMQGMFQSMKHLLHGGTPVQSRTIGSEIPEGRIAEGLGEVQARYPDVDVGSYPFYRGGTNGTSLVLRSTDVDNLEAATEAVRQIIRDLGGTPHEGEIGKPPKEED
jgi:molybdenum cofactor synthesis domain-containing protein